MKWFEHQTTDRELLASRLILRKFGAAGYGIFMMLQEVICDNVESHNIEEWGCVSKDETMESLAEKTHCSIDEFRAFVSFCDESLITSKKNGNLYCDFILDRLNEYAKKARRVRKDEKSGLSGQNGQSGLSGQNGQSGLSDVTNTVTNTKHKQTGESSLSPKAPSLSLGVTHPQTPGAAPGKNPLKEKNGMVPIAGVLRIRSPIPNAHDPGKKKSGTSRAWQDKAFRYAGDLKIILTDEKDLKSRWLRVFRREAVEGYHRGFTDKAYSYLRDIPQELTNEQKIMYFFSIFENGVSFTTKDT